MFFHGFRYWKILCWVSIWRRFF